MASKNDSVAGEEAQELLGHSSLGEDAPSTMDTIILLHGMGGSRNQWMLVWPHLLARGYHVLAVDLPGHAASAAFQPATIEAQATAVASLIRARARGGAAHVVGLSMGGFVTVELARSHAQIVRSAFASGAVPYTGIRLWGVRHPALLDGFDAMWPAWLKHRMDSAMNKAQGLTISPELARDVERNDPGKYTKDFWNSAGKLTLDGMEQIKVRVLAVAGGRMDDVEGTRRQGEVLRRGCEGSRAAVVRQAWHPWNSQLPELFAEGVVAWVEGKALPEEFEDLCS